MGQWATFSDRNGTIEAHPNQLRKVLPPQSGFTTIESRETLKQAGAEQYLFARILGKGPLHHFDKDRLDALVGGPAEGRLPRFHKATIPVAFAAPKPDSLVSSRRFIQHDIVLDEQGRFFRLE